MQLHTLLQRTTPQGLRRRLELELPEGNSLADLPEALEIDLPADAPMLVVNGKH